MSEASIPLPALRILLIDTDRTFHAVLQAAAASLPGAQILNCIAPGEALNRMDGFIPALIIIEGRLGGAAGINFVRRVRAGQTPAPAGTLVMFVSQDFGGGLSGKLVDVGCHALIRKPLSPEALARAIVRTFESPVPQVMGGKYLGPERGLGPPAKHDPERRRTPTRGGWGATHRLSRDGMPLVTMTDPMAKAPDGKVSMAIETAPTPAKPKTPMSLVDDNPPTPARTAPIETPHAKPKPRTEEPMELAPAPAAKTRSREPMDLVDTPAAAATKDEPEFDVNAVIERHRQWIASSGATGSRADLGGLTLPGVSLAGQNLAKANLRGTDLSNADLRKSILIDADLRNAILPQALLDEAQMAGAKIRHADLQFAQLPQTGLQGSDLAGADLRGAVLAGADLSGANLLGTDLRGADVTAINLTQKQLDRAIGDHTTKLPPGLFVARVGDAIDK